MKGLVFILLLFPALCSAQSSMQILRGKIVDEQNDPIPGAYVFFHKTEQHNHSSLFGEFEINDVLKGDTLVISHVGFEGRSIIVENLKAELLIVLKEKLIELNSITISPKIDAINLFSKLNLSTDPVSSSQEILRKVPGLVIGQHAGGGKAEQLFLRGFDIDHGTDINIEVDGLPVNMASHAHGQGYADLHFLIPETIEKIDFGKGPYYANKGNFTTAGYVAFQTKERLKNSTVKLELGRFNTARTLGMFNLLSTENQSAYVGVDYQLTDGPVESPQNFNRANLFAKYTTGLQSDDKISILVSRFSSKWDASGQIPQRLVDDGTITRFGAVDDTEGGITSRTNIKIDHTKKIDESTYIVNSAYYSQYDFELYSNFTFFLLDPINGDQIRQKEKRQIIGGSSEWNKFIHNGANEFALKAGIGFRSDQVDDVELSRSLNRVTTLERIQFGDVNETNINSYVNVDLEFGRLLINPSLRLDYFNFNYNDQLLTKYKTQSADKAFLSPKLNILYNYSTDMQFYLKGGKGFHSNDTRVSVARGGRDILPAAYGSDLGLIWKPIPDIIINTALWALYLDQEFVYVGDAGIVEPSGRTKRVGIDFGIRYQAHRSLYFYSDINYAKPRSRDELEGNNFIPLAPELTLTGGIDVVDFKGFSGSIRYRLIGDRAANEDNSIVADGYFITDMNANYSFNNMTVGFVIENLFNSEWKETQFATESRLSTEVESVEEIHFTPGIPFSIRGSIAFKF